jgi:hypothetical protein
VLHAALLMLTMACSVRDVAGASITPELAALQIRIQVINDIA